MKNLDLYFYPDQNMVENYNGHRSYIQNAHLPLISISKDLLADMCLRRKILSEQIKIFLTFC